MPDVEGGVSSLNECEALLEPFGYARALAWIYRRRGLGPVLCKRGLERTIGSAQQPIAAPLLHLETGILQALGRLRDCLGTCRWAKALVAALMLIK